MNWFLKVLGVVVMVGLVPLLQAEAYGWCFWLAERVVRRAARVLPGQVRGRYQAEWLADLDTLEGRNLFALLWAIKTLMYAPGVRQAVGGRPLRHLAAKRGLDVLVAGLVLLLLAPLLLAIALAVKLTSRGPVVLRQERIGLDGRPFMLLRFRTMYADKRLDALRAQRLNIAQDQRPSRGLVPKRRRNRVTRVGRVLHRYSLNVLPQLINVLRGEMTLVGPRPLWPDEIDLVDSGVVRAWIQARPGLTWPRAGRRRPPPAVSLDD